MSTFYSRLLRRPELDRFLAALKGSPYFKPVDPSGHFSVKQPDVPDLERYHFGRCGTISLSHKTRETRDFVDRSFAILEGCAPHVARAVSALDVAESGKSFDPAEESDVGVAFIIDGSGPAVRISSGDVSPGCADLAYRQRFFNGCFRALGLAGELEAVVDAGRLRLEVKAGRIRFSPEERRPPPGYDPAAANLVLLNMTEPDGSNFHQVLLHLFAPRELRSAAEALVGHLGEAKAVAASLTLVCEAAGYAAVRDILNASGLGPWEITCQAVSGFTIDDLDQAVGMHDSFAIRGFTLRAPKIGSADADIFYSDGTFQVKFTSSSLPSKKMERLKGLIAELAGTPDFLLDEEG